MQMQHQFTVPVPVDQAWKAMLDLERVAPCMPGATLTGVEGNEFTGSVKVKLGPVTLLYKGTGEFKEIDEAGRRVVIDASGKDSRGNGTAAATVTAVLSDEGGTTAVTVDTDLKVTGKPAQLGRGLISEVGGKIIGQFADRLAEQLTGESAEPATAGGPPAAESAEGSTAPKAPAADEPAERPAQPSPADRSVEPSWRVTPVAGPEQQRAQDDEAIDLLGTAGAPVVKRVLPAAAALLALTLLFRIIRRRKHRNS
ncbi:SRPBCC family protein [Saccharopolyspora cebuensis]|uniref:SRPBCC domain-containing protein n=1 Tax=Saccharopolyspora cebuensis TaxID=418759 RepID=A0ABV4CJD0_9PSEU